MFRRLRRGNRDLPPIRRASASIFRKSRKGASVTEGVGLETERDSTPCTGALSLYDRLGVFRPTKDGADKPSRLAKLGRVFARLIVAVRLAFRRPATSPMHATHGPATNGG